VAASPRLSDEVKRRVRQIAGRRMTSEGVLIITAQRFRYQERNREDALQRLIEIIRQAASPPKRRIRTAPSQSVKEARLKEKKLRSARKQRRAKKTIVEE
jgi:ribosome-associated protein